MVEIKKLTILVITITERLQDNSKCYERLGQKCNMDLLKLTRDQAKKFYNHLNLEGLERYDRVLMDLPFRAIFSSQKQLRKIKRLTMWEDDTCQNYIKQSRWHGKFVKFYRSLPGVRVLTTSGFVTEQFIQEGIDAVYIGKSFDEVVIFNKGKNRDIVYAFVGRTNSKVYSLRKKTLDEIASLLPIKMVRSEPGSTYNDLLNRIVYFISADVGLDEYMAKNFEALGAGCVLCTYSIPFENVLVGFKDMENVVLYSSPAELFKKISILEADPALKIKIIKNGLLLAEQHSFQHHADELFNALAVKFSRDVRKINFFEKIFN